MENFVFNLMKTLTYWIFGLVYIGILMLASWGWHSVFSDTPWTFLDAFLAAAIVFVPIVVGKVMTTKDE